MPPVCKIKFTPLVITERAGAPSWRRCAGRATNLDSAGTSSDGERRQDSGMQAAQSVLLIVADDMQPSDIHALRHLHAPPILAETPWQALEHVPMWNFEPQ